jgi:hypothetical protein
MRDNDSRPSPGAEHGEQVRWQARCLLAGVLATIGVMLLASIAAVGVLSGIEIRIGRRRELSEFDKATLLMGNVFGAVFSSGASLLVSTIGIVCIVSSFVIVHRTRLRAE